MSVRITCINKSGGYHEDPHEAISHLGWINESTGEKGKCTRLEMYDWIKNKNGVAYVKDGVGEKAYLTTVINSYGTKYVKTIPDRTKSDNLLYLPEC